MTVTVIDPNYASAPVGMYAESTVISVLPRDKRKVMNHMQSFGYHSADISVPAKKEKKRSRYRFVRLKFLRDVRIEHYDILRDLAMEYTTLLYRRNDLFTKRDMGSTPFVTVCMLIASLLLTQTSKQIVDVSQSYSDLLMSVAAVFAIIGCCSLAIFAYRAIRFVCDRIMAFSCFRKMRVLAEEAKQYTQLPR